LAFEKAKGRFNFAIIVKRGWIVLARKVQLVVGCHEV
jgi:hypothetical protein